jgi:hypothetical protein
MGKQSEFALQMAAQRLWRLETGLAWVQVSSLERQLQISRESRGPSALVINENLAPLDHLVKDIARLRLEYDHVLSLNRLLQQELDDRE